MRRARKIRHMAAMMVAVDAADRSARSVLAGMRTQNAAAQKPAAMTPQAADETISGYLKISLRTGPPLCERAVTMRLHAMMRDVRYWRVLHDRKVLP